MELGQFRRQQHLSALRYVRNCAARCTSMDSAVRLIGKQFTAPMVQVNVLTADEQVTIAAIGGPLGHKPRTDTLCAHVVDAGRPRYLSDIATPPVNSAHIKAYLGVPLTGREGLVIGALCLLDIQPRTFTAAELRDLQAAARVIQDQLELMRRLGTGHYGSTDDAAVLGEAVAGGDIVPYYQPIVDLGTGEVAGVEALARWHHPTRGLLAPAAFIPHTEDSDIILDLDLSILRQGTDQLTRWQREGHPGLGMSVNLSARHFDHPDRLHRASESLDADVSAVTLELTETAALAPNAANQRLLHRLRHRGLRVVLDDFGCGFAAVDQIFRLPIDGIKLDRSITAALGTRGGDAVAGHLIAMAADLGLSTVAEGIEQEQQHRQVRRLGARYGQGFLWAPALSTADMTTYLNTHPADRPHFTAQVAARTTAMCS